MRVKGNYFQMMINCSLLWEMCISGAHVGSYKCSSTGVWSAYASHQREEMHAHEDNWQNCELSANCQGIIQKLPVRKRKDAMTPPPNTKQITVITSMRLRHDTLSTLSLIANRKPPVPTSAIE